MYIIYGNLVCGRCDLIMCSAIVKDSGGILGSPEISKLPFWFQWASVAGQSSSQMTGTDCHEEVPDAGSESVSGQFCYV